MKTGFKILSASILIAINLVLVAVSSVRAETLTIGTISSIPVEETRVFNAFAIFLAGQLKGDGIDTVKVVIAADINEMASLLKSKQADLYIDSSVTALAVNKLSGSTFMLRRWKKGQGKYRSVIFVLEESNITKLGDLKGKIIAFEELFSTSGFMLPILVLRQQGLVMTRLKSFRRATPPGEVGYVMAYDNESQAVWLERGHVQAAAMAEKDFKDFSKTTIKPFRVIDTTSYVPYHVISNRPGLDAKLVARLSTILKTAHQTPEGRKALEQFERTSKFDDIPDELQREVEKFEPYLNTILGVE
ncbi:MAG: hypothetical protein COB59_04680 [Rhodospirillaceae bacterium]|nr:MAG: hypothetical protein COB59_04680 [Rhodospirillaceae bacterium]